MAKDKLEKEFETVIKAETSVDIAVNKKKKKWFLKLLKP